MMIRWSKIYETGISVVDFQNKELVGAINEFYKCIFTDNMQKDAESNIRKMIMASVKLFSVEKGLFDTHEYYEDEKRSHLEDHDVFLKMLTDTLQKLKTGDVLSAYKLADFLRNWIVEHMMTSDRKFAEFASQHKIPA